MVRLIFVIIFPFLLISCTTAPLSSRIQGEKLSESPFMVRRVFVIADFPAEYKSNFAQLLVNHTIANLRSHNVEASSHVHAPHPLALVTGIDFRPAIKFKSDMIIILQMRERRGGGNVADWVIGIDILDKEGRRAWRGTSKVFHGIKTESALDVFAKELLGKLIDDSVIIFPEAKDSGGQ